MERDNECEPMLDGGKVTDTEITIRHVVEDLIPEFWHKKQVADRWGITLRTLQNYVSQGTVPTVDGWIHRDIALAGKPRPQRG